MKNVFTFGLAVTLFINFISSCKEEQTKGVHIHSNLLPPKQTPPGTTVTITPNTFTISRKSIVQKRKNSACLDTVFTYTISITSMVGGGRKQENTIQAFTTQKESALLAECYELLERKKVGPKDFSVVYCEIEHRYIPYRIIFGGKTYSSTFNKNDGVMANKPSGIIWKNK